MPGQRPVSGSYDHVQIPIHNNHQQQTPYSPTLGSSTQGALSPQSLSFASSERNYRHSRLVESGDYVHPPPPSMSLSSGQHTQGHRDLAISPATSYASAHSGGARSSMDIDTNVSPTNMAPYAGLGVAGNVPPPPQSSSYTGSSGSAINRMPSIGHLGPSTPHRSSHAGVSGVGRSISISGMGSIMSDSPSGTRSRRTSSTHRMVYSPNPPVPSQMMSQPQSDLSSGMPPQAGLMRRGLSYDGNFVPSSPSQQIRLPMAPQQTTSNSNSLLPTAYSYGSSISPKLQGQSAASSIGPPPASPSATIFFSPNPNALNPSSHAHGHSATISTDHNRHTSYSPSQYAAPGATPTSAHSFYAHHIPTTSATAPPVPLQQQQLPPPPMSSSYQQQQQQQQSSGSFYHYDNTATSSSQTHNVGASSGSSSNPNAAAYYAGGELVPVTSRSENRSAEPIVGFRKVRDVRDIVKHVNAQPAGRRADPNGGFISPLKALTISLPQTYHIVNPSFRYETSLNPRRVLTKPSKPASNDGFDNEDSDYILYVNDVLGPEDKERYLILDVLGQGTFGQVVKCQNMKTHEIVAVKVVKNKPAYFQQSMMEVTILELLNNQWDKDDTHHMLRLKDTFIHHSHLCLVFELLSNNLYELIKQNSFRGLSTSLVRVFTAQLLDALTVLNEAKIIHCDLKPENILLKSLQSPTIKVIDFGSACHERQTVYTYIQSRFYRSPEVILSNPYCSAIDMWSLGCICVELFLGLPLFPGTSEYNQISRIVEMLGIPPDHMLETGKQVKNFFEGSQDEYGRRRWRLKSIDRYSQEHNTQEQPSKKYFSAETLPDIIKQYPILKRMKEGEVEKEINNRLAFIDFVQGLLQIDPALRWSPQQARLHPFVLGEPLKGPYIPAPHLKPGAAAIPRSIPSSPDPKRYGGLPPAPQRNTNRTYQDAKAYNQHLNQQQTYHIQAQQAAQRAAQMPTNPYQLADGTARQMITGPPPPANLQMQATQQMQPQGQYGSAPYYGPNIGNGRPPQTQGIAGLPVTNPPPVHHYTTQRARSNTINQDLPPALQKLGQEFQMNPGQSITPVLRREDQHQAWEMMRDGSGTEGGSGLPRRISISQRAPHLLSLQEQAENGLNSWHSPMRPKQGGAYTYQSPILPGQPQFHVVVEQRDRQQADLFGSGIAPPPQAYAGVQGSARYNPYPAGPLQQPQAYEQSPFDGYDAQAGLSHYQPMQPMRAQASQQMPPPSLQSSYYSPQVPTNVFPPLPSAGSKSKESDLWGR